MILTLLDNFKGFETSVEGGTADSCSEKSRIKLMKPEDVTGIASPSHDKTLTDENCFLDEQKK